MLIIDDAVRARFPGVGQKRQNDGSDPGNEQREVNYKVAALDAAHSGRTITRQAESPLLYVRAKKRNGKLPLVNKISLVRGGSDSWPNQKSMILKMIYDLPHVDRADLRQSLGTSPSTLPPRASRAARGLDFGKTMILCRPGNGERPSKSDDLPGTFD